MPSTGQDMHSSRTLALRPHQVTTGQAPRTRPAALGEPNARILAGARTICLAQALVGNPNYLATSGLGLCVILPPRTGWRRRCMSVQVSDPDHSGKNAEGICRLFPRELMWGQRLVAPARQPDVASARLAQGGRERAVVDLVQWMKTILCPVSGAFIFTAYDSH